MIDESSPPELKWDLGLKGLTGRLLNPAKKDGNGKPASKAEADGRKDQV